MYVLDFRNLRAPAVLNCVFVEGLADFQLLDRGDAVFIGSTTILYEIQQNSYRQIKLSAPQYQFSAPTVSFYDKGKQLLFVGFKTGVTEVFSVQQNGMQYI